MSCLSFGAALIYGLFRMYVMCSRSECMFSVEILFNYWFPEMLRVDIILMTIL